MGKKVNHQFGLFGYVKPKLKVPISKEKILKAEKFIKEQNSVGAVRTLRDLREDLERFERSL